MLILNACTFEEEIIKQNGYQEKIKLESKKFSELMQLPAFSNAYKRVINKKVALSNDLAARTALEDQYGFTIVEDKDAKVITDIDGSISYSMLIERAEKENLKFENLIINVKDTIIKAMTFKYTLSEKAVYNQESGVYSMNIIESEMTPLTIDGRETIGGVICVEIQTYQLVSDSSWTTQMPTYHYEWVTTATYCSSGGAGGNSWTGGDNVGTTVSSNPSNGGYPQQGGNPHSNGGGSGPVINNGPSVNTAPIVDDDVVENDEPINHIEQLNTITNRTEVKERILELKTQVTTVPNEQGTEFFVNEENPNTVYDEEDTPLGPTGVMFSPIDYYSIIRLHSHHYPGLEPVFSGQDVKNAAVFFKTKLGLGADDANNVTSILVSTGIYALRVTDENKAKQFAIRASNDTFVKIFLKNYTDKVRKKSQDDCNCTFGSAYEQALLSNLILFLISENTGLSLYSATVTTSGNLSWSLLP